MDDKRWSDYQAVLDRHERDIALLRESVEASLTTITTVTSRWMAYQAILDRHEMDVAQLKESVKASISTVTARLIDHGDKLDDQRGRLDNIERKTMDHGEKLDKLVSETSGQSVILDEIKSMVYSNKDDQARQLAELGDAKEKNLSKMVKIEGDLGDLSCDLRLVKKAVVHSKVNVIATRAYRALVLLAIIVGGSVILSILWAFPQMIPLMVRVFERVVTGGAH